MKSFLLLLSLLVGAGATLSADLTVVNENGDSSTGSLRKAIEDADPGDRILFDPAVVTINIAFLGELVIDKDITIDASANSTGVTVTAGGTSRVFRVDNPAVVELINLTIRDGKSADGDDAPGGGQGDPGENGAGILNDATLTLRHCRILDNTTGNGGDATADAGGSGGGGGGIYSSGDLTVIDSVISGNATGDGGNSGEFPGMPPTARKGANGGRGGGISFVSSGGTLTIERTAVSGNTTGDGGNGTGQGGDGGPGGGLFSSGTTMAIEDSTISNNRTGIGGNSSPAYPFDGGLGGSGGGIAIIGLGLDTIITNSTISGNETGGGGIHGSVAADPGRGGHGGGIFTRGGNPASPASILMLDQVTITNNTTGRGISTLSDGGSGGGMYLGYNASGFDRQGDVTMNNTVVAGNAVAQDGISPDIELNDGTITPTGVNFIGVNSSVETEFPAGPLAGTSAAPLDPLVGSLGNNGGATETHSPLANSPLVDPVGGSTVSVLDSDQRGRPRRSGFRVDIGAVEFFLTRPRIISRNRITTKRERVVFPTRVVSLTQIRLNAQARLGAKARAKGARNSFRVTVTRIRRKVVSVRLTARDTFGQRASKVVRIKKR